MFPASTKAGGMCVGFPDVCLTPAPPSPSPIPIPYPNMGQCSNANDAIDKVKIKNKAVLVEKSKIPSSSGDEAGTSGGVTSGSNRDEIGYKKSSSKVYAKGKKMVMLTSMTGHNGSSANFPAGMQVSPSQTSVLIAD